MNAYIDASALVPYYMTEPLSQKAQHLVLGADSVAVSNLGEVEFFCTVARKVRLGDVGGRGAAQIRSRFLSHLEQFFFERLPVQAAHYQLARSWLANETLPLSTLDSLHVAVASISGCTLLTADTQQARAAEELGVAVKLLG